MISLIGIPEVFVVTMQSGSDDLFDLGKKLLFDLQILDDDLDDPVDIGKPAEVVLKIAGPDHGGVLFGEETGRL